MQSQARENSAPLRISGTTNSELLFPTARGCAQDIASFTTCQQKFRCSSIYGLLPEGARLFIFGAFQPSQLLTFFYPPLTPLRVNGYMLAFAWAGVSRDT